MRHLLSLAAILVALAVAPSAFAGAAAKIKAHSLANGGLPPAGHVAVGDDGPGVGGGY